MINLSKTRPNIYVRKLKRPIFVKMLI